MAIKKRETKKPVVDQDIAAKVEQFAAAADGGVVNEAKDPSASRDYKAIRVPFNQYEYEQLEIACQITGRSKLNFIRYAMMTMAKEAQGKKG